MCKGPVERVSWIRYYSSEVKKMLGGRKEAGRVGQAR